LHTTRCKLDKLLVVPTFVARRLQVRKDARDPSGESWNYLSRRLSCNLAEMTSSTPFRDLWTTPTIKLSVTKCVFKAWLATNHIKRVIILAFKNICAAYHFVIAPTEYIRVLVLDLRLSLEIMISNYYLSQLNNVLYDVRHVA